MKSRIKKTKKLIIMLIVMTLVFLGIPGGIIIAYGETASTGNTQNAEANSMWIGDVKLSVSANMSPVYLLTDRDKTSGTYGKVTTEGATADNYHVKVEADQDMNITITMEGAMINPLSAENKYGILGPVGKHVTLKSPTATENYILGNETGIKVDSLTIETKGLDVIGYDGHGIQANGTVTIAKDGDVSINAYNGDAIRAEGDIIVEGFLGECHGMGDVGGYALKSINGDVVISGDVTGTIHGTKVAIAASNDVTISGTMEEIKGDGTGIYGMNNVTISGTIKQIKADEVHGVGAGNNITISGQITEGISAGQYGISANQNIDIKESAVIKNITAGLNGLHSGSGSISFSGTITEGITAGNYGIAAYNGSVTLKAPISVTAQSGAIIGGDIVLEGVYVSLPENGYISKPLGESYYYIVDSNNDIANEVKLENADGANYTKYKIWIGGVEVEASAVEPAYLLLDANGKVVTEGASSDNYDIRYTVDNAGNATVLLKKDLEINEKNVDAIYINRDSDLTIIGQGECSIVSNQGDAIWHEGASGNIIVEGSFKNISGTFGIYADKNVTLNGKISNIEGTNGCGIVAFKVTITEAAEVGSIKAASSDVNSTTKGMAIWAGVTILSPVELYGDRCAIALSTGANLDFGEDPWYQWTTTQGGDMTSSKDQTFSNSGRPKYLKIEYTSAVMTFDAGEGSEGSDKMTNISPASKRFPLPESTFIPPAGHLFKAWEIEDKEYQPGAQVRFFEDVTATAVYEKIPAELGDISTSESVTITYGQSCTIGVTMEEDVDVYDYTYQWYDEAGLIQGATAITYTLPTDYPAGDYSFYCSVSATRKDNGNTATKESKTVAVIINKANQQSLKITGVPDKIIVGDTFTLSATGGASGCRLIWEITSGADCATVNKDTGKVTVSSAGSFTVKVSSTGNDNYYDISSETSLVAKKNESVDDGTNPDGGNTSGENGDNNAGNGTDDEEKHVPAAGYHAMVEGSLLLMIASLAVVLILFKRLRKLDR